MSLEKRERLPVSVSSAVFVEDEQGRLLLVQQASERKGYRWGPPAGGLEAHESPIYGALREVKEEIGVDAKLIDLIGIYTVDRGDKLSGIGFVFRGRVNFEDIVLKTDEIKDVRFFSQKEIRQLVDEDKLYKPEYNLAGVQDWLNGSSYPIESIKPIIKRA